MGGQQHCYEFARPAVSVDAVILLSNPSELKLLLIQRKNEPYQGKWALPGGFMDMHETTEQAMHREVQEETGLTGLAFTRIDLFDKVDRDPRGRSLTYAFAAYANPDQKDKVTAGDDAATAQWFDLDQLPELAFDHNLIVRVTLDKLGL